MIKNDKKKEKNNIKMQKRTKERRNCNVKEEIVNKKGTLKLTQIMLLLTQ